jgi:hypothetical protein
MNRFLSKYPWFLSALAWVTYALGAVWRWFYVVDWHDPRKYVYSDMRMYMDLAKRLADPKYVVRMGDITHPPGTAWLLVYFLKRDPTLQEHVYFNFAVCALVPLAVGALGWVTFGKRTGEASMVIASVYYTFVDFGGYFLAEIHIALVATLTIVAYFLATKIAAEPPSPKRTILWVATSVVGGLFFSLAMVLKMVAMPAIGGFFALHFLFAKTPKRITRAVILAIFMVSAAPLTGYVAQRCTTANEGHFCTGSNKSAADFLLGHYGRIQGIEWHDPKTRGVIGFGSPAAFQHGYQQKEVVQFLITDQKKNNEAAWTWVRRNPGQAVVLSFEHVWDIFGGSYPWPPNATAVWPYSYASHYLFLFLVIFPAGILLIDVLRGRGVMGLLRSPELLVISPIFGVCLSVFVATGEVRYRVPWDGVFMVLAVEFYRRMTLRFREVPADGAPSADKPESLAPTRREGTPRPPSATPGTAGDDAVTSAPEEAEPQRADAKSVPPEKSDDEPTESPDDRSDA